jgi:hypothetical protein
MVVRGQVTRVNQQFVIARKRANESYRKVENIAVDRVLLVSPVSNRHDAGSARDQRANP